MMVPSVSRIGAESPPSPLGAVVTFSHVPPVGGLASGGFFICFTVGRRGSDATNCFQASGFFSKYCAVATDMGGGTLSAGIADNVRAAASCDCARLSGIAISVPTATSPNPRMALKCNEDIFTTRDLAHLH